MLRRRTHSGYTQVPDPAQEAASTNRHARMTRLRLVAGTICTVGVLLACSSPQVVQLSKAPADQLGLRVNFTGALIPSTLVIIDVNVFESDRPSNYVDLNDNQHLTVNGQDQDRRGPPGIKLSSGSYQFTVPRPPDGGSYTISYTDKQGQQTSVVVPAPLRAFAITSPAANARLPIPQSSASTPASFTVQYTVPFDDVALPAIVNTFPQQYDADIRGGCKTRGPDGTPASSPYCMMLLGRSGSSQQSIADSITIQDQADSQPKYRFYNLAPGPGYIGMTARVTLLLQRTDFGSVSVDFSDGTTIPVIWV
jgi:hypothetical protein